MPIIFHIAMRNLKKHRLRSTISGILLFFSALAIIVVSTACLTITENMSNAVVGSCTGDIQVHNGDMEDIDVYSSPVAEIPILLDSESMEKEIMVSGVDGITSRVRLQGLLMIGDQSTTTMVTGIDASKEDKILDRIITTEGSWLTKENGLIIGQELYDNLGAKVGEEVNFYVNDSNGEVKEIKFTIEGVFTSDGLSIYMDTYMFGDLNYIRTAMGYTNGEATEIVLRVKDNASRNQVLRKIDDKIDKNNLNLRADKWEDIAATYGSIITASSMIPVACIILVFFVVGIGLLNTILMVVMERTRESRIFMAIGTSRVRIVLTYALEFLFLGFISSLLSVVVSLPIILALGSAGIPAKTEMLSYVFGGAYLYIQCNPWIFVFAVLIFTVFPALVAFLCALKGTKNLSLVSIN